MTSNFTCPTCNGSGNKSSEIKCTSCLGGKTILCTNCHEGAIPCNECGGSGKRGIFKLSSCKRCHGSGVLICPVCNGTTRMGCPECNGSGIISQSAKCMTCNGSGRDYSVLKNWSIERIRFELDVLEKNNKQLYAELRELEGCDCSDGRGYPVGIDYNYNLISKNDTDIEILRNIIRNKI